MRLVSALSTELFVGTPQHPEQVLSLELAEVSTATEVIVTGADGAECGRAEVAPGQSTVEIGLRLAAEPVGSHLPVTVSADGAEAISATVVVAEPGWTVWMVPHFHYDPVWWNTQAAYTATWDELGEEAQRTRMAFQQTGFALVALHLEVARADPDYKFVLAEVDYLKPYWDARPDDRDYLRRLIRDGRLEIMGGTYNEPNTNLTSAETTIRNFEYGLGFQRDILGADPQTAWQLDAFGHDPQFPGLAAAAGLTSSSWARGPFHQWGPMLSNPSPDGGWGDPSSMQFDAEFEWISPSGGGVLTHYMPAHYSAGWQIDSQTDLAGAEQAVYELFGLLKRVAATRNVLLPVGTDYTPPSKWVTEIHRDWAARYVWPRFACAVPSEFFAAVRAELAETGRALTPQTRDMNPIYTGKDVSFIDTKQVQRAAEAALIDAEKFASVAARYGARYPFEAMDKAWRQLVYGAHHDAITGSESDQVYLDLLTGWREAHDIGTGVRAAATAALASVITPADVDDSGSSVGVTVFNPSGWARSDLVRVRVELPSVDTHDVEVVDPSGAAIAHLCEHEVRRADGSLASTEVAFVAEVPSFGWSSGWRIRPVDRRSADQPSDGWTELAPGDSIESDRFRLAVDASRGGGVRELVDRRDGRSLLAADAVGNELILEREYSEHPDFHEGPWHLVPTGEAVGTSTIPAESVRRFSSPMGQRLEVTGRIGSLRYRQRYTLWMHTDRIDCSTTLDGFDASDTLIRARWPIRIVGGMPVSEVADAVVGRGFALLGEDSATHPWTLDNPANSWFALSSTVRIDIATGSDRDTTDGAVTSRAIGVAELVAPDSAPPARLRDLAVALAGQGVTSTTSRGNGPRYGRLAVDSNLPDVRIALGGPDENSFVAQRLAQADPQYQLELDKQLAQSASALLWVPATSPLAEVWQPSADLSDGGALPVLVVVGDAAIDAVIDDLVGVGDSGPRRPVIGVSQHADAGSDQPFDDYTVGIVNTGMPGFAVQPDGTMNLSLMRSCTGWPSGVWIDPPRRTAPDGSNFQLQHWSHRFDYSLVAEPGDWRDAGLVRAGHDRNHELIAVVDDRESVGKGGVLTSSGSFLTVNGADDVVLAAITPGPAELARAAAVPETVTDLRVRTYSSTGRTSSGRLIGSLGPDAVDLPIELGPMQISTVTVPGGPSGSALVGRELADRTEPHQPIYSRYWLNNTGPAPIGNLPLSVTVEPTVIEPAPGSTEPMTVHVTVASERTDAAVAGRVRVLAPAGWRVTAEGLDYELEPGAHRSWPITLTPTGDSGSGIGWLRVQTDYLDQVVEDVARVITGSPKPELDVEFDLPDGLVPGQAGEAVLTLTSNASDPISAQVQLIAPGPMWPMLPEYNTGVEVGAGEQVTLRLPINPPVGTEPGSWWVLAKVAAAGRLHYSPALPFEVRSSDASA